MEARESESFEVACATSERATAKKVFFHDDPSPDPMATVTSLAPASCSFKIVECRNRTPRIQARWNRTDAASDATYTLCQT